MNGEYEVDLSRVRANEGDVKEPGLGRDLQDVDRHLRDNGHSLRALLEHVSRTAFGVSFPVIAPPKLDVEAPPAPREARADPRMLRR